MKSKPSIVFLVAEIAIIASLHAVQIKQKEDKQFSTSTAGTNASVVPPVKSTWILAGLSVVRHYIPSRY